MEMRQNDVAALVMGGLWVRRSERGEAGVVEVWSAVGAEVDLALEGGDDGVGEVDAVQLLA